MISLNKAARNLSPVEYGPRVPLHSKTKNWAVKSVRGREEWQERKVGEQEN